MWSNKTVGQFCCLEDASLRSLLGRHKKMVEQFALFSLAVQPDSVIKRLNNSCKLYLE
jgi:hypothetical protein